MSDEQPSPRPTRIPLYLIIYNISKKANVRTLFAAAAAFGAEVLLVGQPTFSFETHVPRALPSWARGEGAIRHRFDHLDECCAFLKNEGIPIYGVEIVEGATSIEELPFTGGVAIMLGNEGTGMSAKQLSKCDAFVYIPQYGRGTASLNVAVAASIVLQRFHQWRKGQTPPQPTR